MIDDDIDEVSIEVNPGAGSQDWAEMLIRMYMRWAERHNYRSIIRTVLAEGEFKSGALTIYGARSRLLISEEGWHRLARPSSFDSHSRTCMAFAEVEITPLIAGHVVEPPYWRTGGFGQIRSYVFTPYKMIAKDLRTGVTREDVETVLDGDIDDFLDGAAAAGIPHKRDPNAPVPEGAVMDAAI